MGVSLPTNIVIVSVVFGILNIIVLAGRFWSRRRTGPNFGTDDYLILPGALAAISLSVLMVVMVYQDGLGGSVDLDANGQPLDPAKVVRLFKLEFAVQLVSVLALLFTKISIICFYRRIFRGNRFAIVSWILIGLVSVWGIAFFFATLFECYPIYQVWTIDAGQRQCYAYVPIVYGTVISNFVIDVLILVVPQPMVWRLQMATKQKIGVSALFLLGAFVCGISIARIYFFVAKHYNSVTYSIAPSIYWSQIEAAVAVICACLPCMTPVFLKIGRCLQNIFTDLKLVSLSSSDSRSDKTDRAMMAERSMMNSQLREERLTGVTGFVNVSSSASIRGGCGKPAELEGRWEPQQDEIAVHTVIMSNEEKV